LPEDRYEPWVEERRTQLKELYLSLLFELAALYEERGEEIGEAIEALERVVTQEPAHEGAHVGLMRLYAVSGSRREALRQYERLREALLKEWGTEPEAATTRLQQEIWAGTFPPGDFTPAGFPLEDEAPSPAGVRRRHNLPIARTSFVGREREKLEVKRRLAMTRLLTLTGAGGCGKTRLALKVARDLVGAYPDGVWLVELAPLSDPTLIAQAVAKALGVREQPGRPLLETLKDTLRAKKMLLVVDNCEHLVEAVVALVDRLLGTCPSLRVLATSRETLNASGEVNWVVPSLTVPFLTVADSRQGAYTPQELGAYESATLFMERARQRDPTFLLTLQNGQAVAQICQRLEGIPLAIELAAARIGVLSAEQLALRLDDYLKLLSRGERTAEPRHRSLRATLAWSHELLSEPEQLLFRRLSVFAGGWTLEAAEEVCSGEGIGRDDVLDLISELVERSLVVAEAGDEEVVRFRMLEPIRQYGQEFLEESGESEALRSRHAGYYLALTEGADAQVSERQLSEARPVAWLGQMEAEHANLRAALSWSLDEDAEEPDDRRVELGLRLAVALFWFWHTHAHQIEGQRYLERAASGRSDLTTTRLRAQALHGAAWIAQFQVDYEAAKALMEESLALYREVGDNESIASGLTQLGMVAVLGQRDDIPLRAVLEELWELKPRIKNRTTLVYLFILEGLIAASRGDLEHSATLHEESLELSRQIRDPQSIFTCLAHLGYIGLLKADYEGTVSRLREALRLGWERDYKVAIQNSIYVLASVAASREQPVRAARLWGAVEGMEEAYGVHLTSMARSIINYEGRLAAARSLLDEETWLEAWAQGKSMSLEQAVEYALSEEERHEPPTLVAVPEQQQFPPVDKPTGRLTPREREVALLVGRGLTNRQIAKELSISDRTVENHIGKILKKQGFFSRAGIATWVAHR
jgi:predicted ATPase/DNA-binding CsgD family transcriptional regulator